MHERAAFDALATLVGDWEGTTDAGRLIRVAYTLHAKGSVLRETWALGPTSDALTLYSVDLDSLVARHYCPLGNQPRLLLAAASTPTAFVFDFHSAENLADLGTAHQHRFEVRLLSPDSFWRSETYVEGADTYTDAVTYRRR